MTDEEELALRMYCALAPVLKPLECTEAELENGITFCFSIARMFQRVSGGPREFCFDSPAPIKPSELTIDDIGLKRFTWNRLNKPRIHADKMLDVPREIDKLATVPACDLLKIRYFGRVCLADLDRCLRDHGYNVPGAAEYLPSGRL